DVLLAASTPGRRMLDHSMQLYYDEAVLAAASLGATGSRGLPFESYQLALTAGLVTKIGNDAVTLTQGHFDTATLPGILTSTGDDGGHYVLFSPDSGYWTRSGQVTFTPNPFFLPTDLIDPLGKHSFVTYDTFNLLLTQAQDPLGNIIQA